MRWKVTALGLVIVAGSASLFADRRDGPAGPTIAPAISFEGLVALVKSPAFDRGAVVAIDPTHATLSRYLPRHEAIMSIPMAAVREGRPDYFADADHRIGVWRLEGQRVSFNSSIPGDVLQPVRTANDARYPRSKDEWRDVKWIVDMERIVGRGNASIKSEFMTSADLRNSIVSSRIDLRAGMIEATEPPEPYSGAEVRFLPLKGVLPTQPAQQAATQRIVYSPTPSTNFEINLAGSEGSPLRRISLKPADASIPITISNHTTMATLTNGESPTQGVHFLAYYDLLASSPLNIVVPSALVPFPMARTIASPGFYCDPNPPLLNSSFSQ